MIDYDYERVYEYKIENMAFGSLPRDVVIDLFKDGRVASHFLERQLEVWFPELTFVNAKGHDHVDTEGNLYDQKCFTKCGLGFAPSHMGGKGRIFVQEEAHEHAKNVTYICCDIVEFPKVRVVFRRGADLIVDYPKCQIKFKDRENFFK